LILEEYHFHSHFALHEDTAEAVVADPSLMQMMLIVSTKGTSDYQRLLCNEIDSMIPARLQSLQLLLSSSFESGDLDHCQRRYLASMNSFLPRHAAVMIEIDYHIEWPRLHLDSPSQKVQGQAGAYDIAKADSHEDFQ
jgi:hypothetical protein